MRLAAIFAAIALGWAAITGAVSLPNLVLGAAIGALAVYLLRDRLGVRFSLHRAGRIAALAGLFGYELMASALRVAALVLRPNLRSALRPAIVAFPLTVTSDAEITLLANLITLTPGTLTVDVTPDRQQLLIHAVHCTDPDALIRDIASGFERRILEVFE